MCNFELETVVSLKLLELLDHFASRISKDI